MCDNKTIHLHGFCDSSGVAYCASIYIFSSCSHGITLNLLTSKCRLVPLKSFTIPRLELLACQLLSKLVVSVCDALKGEVDIASVFCWSDSMVALWWIKQVHKKGGVWVQNRVNVIRKSVSRHLSTLT